MSEKCCYCKQDLDDPSNPHSLDCGGNCWSCQMLIEDAPDNLVMHLEKRFSRETPMTPSPGIQFFYESYSWIMKIPESVGPWGGCGASIIQLNNCYLDDQPFTLTWTVQPRESRYEPGEYKLSRPVATIHPGDPSWRRTRSGL